VQARHEALFASWREQARADWDAVPITLPRLASEIWSVIKDEDWVLTANTLQDWAYKLWDFDKPYRHPGQALGTGTQIGISLGVALAHRGKGRLVLDIQPDGDLLFDAGALWSAAKNNIPLLVVMYNNRAYYNDWEHQIHVAQHRGTPVERAYIAQDIAGPDPDFAAMANSMGWYAEGPIEEPAAPRRCAAPLRKSKPVSRRWSIRWCSRGERRQKKTVRLALFRIGRQQFGRARVAIVPLGVIHHVGACQRPLRKQIP
jgi:acetolactate synthase I/II/III large subunit